jgi:hypothetical protein
MAKGSNIFATTQIKVERDRKPLFFSHNHYEPSQHFPYLLLATGMVVACEDWPAARAICTTDACIFTALDGTTLCAAHLIAAHNEATKKIDEQEALINTMSTNETNSTTTHPTTPATTRLDILPASTPDSGISTRAWT